MVTAVTVFSLPRKAHWRSWNNDVSMILLPFSYRSTEGAYADIRPATAISFKNILFLTDFGQASAGALAYSLAFARHFKARLFPRM